MSKVIVVDRCIRCPDAFQSYISSRSLCDLASLKECPDEGIPDWCPLPGLPEKADESPYDNAGEDTFIAGSYEAGFAKGWNTCLRIITEENGKE